MKIKRDHDAEVLWTIIWGSIGFTAIILLIDLLQTYFL